MNSSGHECRNGAGLVDTGREEFVIMQKMVS